MRKLISAIILCVLLGGQGLQAGSNGEATDKSRCQLTIELRDGSRMVGKALADTVSFHAAALGDMKLPWAGIRAIEYAGDSGTARLTATNGDGFTVQLAGDTLGLQTSFGKSELPVNLIRSIKVAPEIKTKTIPATPAVSATGFRLTIELRDGSHLVGKGLDDALNFHSATMGDLKLTWAGIRSVIYTSEKVSTARLTTTNGDAYEVEFVTPAVRVETSFGKTELPAKSIRNIKVSAMGKMSQLLSGLVALWSGEGDGNDAVGRNNANLNNITFADGKVGQSFFFNGINARIRVPASSSLNVGVGEGLTVVCWINAANLNMQELCEWNQNNGVPYGAAQIGTHLEINESAGDGSLRGNVVDTSGVSHNFHSENGIIIPNCFQHVAMTYDKASGTGVLYRNGVAVATSNLGVFTPQTSFDFFLGSRPSGFFTGIFFQGKMDEIAVYNRALAAEEIQSLAAAANPER